MAEVIAFGVTILQTMHSTQSRLELVHGLESEADEETFESMKKLMEINGCS